MVCPKCHVKNPFSIRFCGQCGHQLKVPCGACEFENPWDFRFCGGCGHGLQPVEPETDPQRDEAERRPVSVMFCDLVGSTALSQNLDPEELREVVRNYQKVACGVIERFNGHVAQYLGDGLLVYFGYPSASDNDAQLAVLAGLGIVEEVPRIEATQDTRLAVRVGIDTGDVVVGDMGGGRHHERLALGDTPNIAARVQGLASPNSVLVSRNTFRLVQKQFRVEDLGPQVLKGINKEINVYSVLGSAETRRRAVQSGQLIGRDHELSLLRDRWNRALNGSGQTVLLSAEAGVGKSRLLKALSQELEGEMLLLQCYCSPYFRNTALQPVIELLSWIFAFSPDDGVEQRIVKVRESFIQFGLPSEPGFAILADLVSLAGPDHGLPPDKLKEGLLDVLSTIVLQMSDRSPLMLVFQDLQWADPTTLELLSLLMEQLRETPVLLIISYRPEFSPPWPVRTNVTHLTLSRLGPDQVKKVAVQIAGAELPPDLLDYLVERADGVPLFVEELTRMVLETGILKKQDDQFELTQPLETLAIPGTLKGSLMARLDKMESAKQVAQVGSTIGREFAYDLLQILLPLEEESLRGALQRLVKAELLICRAPSTYRFRQALVQEAAYRSLLKRKRKELHRAIVVALEEHYAEVCDTQPELLAHHSRKGGLNQQALGYLQRAASRAALCSAHEEAVNHLRRALKLLENLPAAPAQTEIDLLAALGPPLSSLHGFAAPEVERTYRRAQELIEELGGSPRLFPIMAGLCRYHLVRGRLNEARGMAETLVTIAKSTPVGEDNVVATLALGVATFYRGHFAEALGYLEGSQVEQHHDELQTLRHGQHPGVTGLAYMGWTLWCLGRPTEAFHKMEEAIEKARSIGHPFSLGLALIFSAWLHAFANQWRAVAERASETMDLAREHGFEQWLWLAAIFNPLASAHLTDSQDTARQSIRAAREGLDHRIAAGAELARPCLTALLASAWFQCGGDKQEASELLKEASRQSKAHGDKFFDAEILRNCGLVNPGEQAVEDFRQALQVAEEQGALMWALRAARELHRSGQEKEHLRRILGHFPDQESAELTDARSLLLTDSSGPASHEG
jgi:class 3 adenylate cyclase/tetratricopeptide (TPR) repeat protein